MMSQNIISLAQVNIKKNLSTYIFFLLIIYCLPNYAKTLEPSNKNSVIEIVTNVNASSKSLYAIAADISLIVSNVAGTSSRDIEFCSIDMISVHQTTLFANLRGADKGGTWTDAIANTVIFPITTTGTYYYVIMKKDSTTSESLTNSGFLEIVNNNHLIIVLDI